MGVRAGIKDNIMDALDLTYYGQLKDKVLGYSQVTIVQFIWTATQAYFEGVIQDHEEFENNTGGRGKRVKFDLVVSVHEADKELGDDLRWYIEGLASEKEAKKQNVANMQAATDQMLAVQSTYKNQFETKDSQIKELVEQIKSLTESVTVLTKMVTSQQ